MFSAAPVSLSCQPVAPAAKRSRALSPRLARLAASLLWRWRTPRLSTASSLGGSIAPRKSWQHAPLLRVLPRRACGGGTRTVVYCAPRSVADASRVEATWWRTQRVPSRVYDMARIKATRREDDLILPRCHLYLLAYHARINWPRAGVEGASTTLVNMAKHGMQRNRDR